MRSKHFAIRRVSRSCSCQKPARNASATDRYRDTTVQMPVAPARSDPTPRRARNSSAPARENPTVFAMYMPIPGAGRSRAFAWVPRCRVDR